MLPFGDDVRPYAPIGPFFKFMSFKRHPSYKGCGDRAPARGPTYAYSRYTRAILEVPSTLKPFRLARRRGIMEVK